MDPATLAQIELSGDRIIMICENVSVDMASIISNALIYYQQTGPEEPITLCINSNGGDISGLLHLYDVIQTISCPIHTVCLGKAFSAGAWLLALGTKGQRKAMKNSKVMIHGAQLAFPNTPDIAEASSTNYLSFVEKLNNRILAILASHSNHTVERVREDCRNDVWLTAQQALEYGLVDEVI